MIIRLIYYAIKRNLAAGKMTVMIPGDIMNDVLWIAHDKQEQPRKK